MLLVDEHCHPARQQSTCIPAMAWSVLVQNTWMYLGDILVFLSLSIPFAPLMMYCIAFVVRTRMVRVIA